jgi:NAD(P)-dependent dehydrogenase (short-subunit alcohol dehydrogenase family)
MARNILITGGNSGIGLEMARALAGAGDRVVIAARDAVKSAAAVADIKSSHAAAQIEALSLDLGDFTSIDRFAAQLLATMPLIDVLILNAGLYTLKPRALANGYESMIGIMHFGHFRLAQLLLPAVEAAPQGRIVVTSSMMHALGRIRDETFKDCSKQSGAGGYAQAKLANLLFTRELARRLAGTRVTVNAFHPGAVGTAIYRETPGFFSRLINLFMLSPRQGADTGTWLATAPELEKTSGEYFVKRRKKAGSAASRDMTEAARLWSLSEQA